MQDQDTSIYAQIAQISDGTISEGMKLGSYRMCSIGRRPISLTSHWSQDQFVGLQPSGSVKIGLALTRAEFGSLIRSWRLLKQRMEGTFTDKSSVDAFYSLTSGIVRLNSSSNSINSEVKHQCIEAIVLLWSSL